MTCSHQFFCHCQIVVHSVVGDFTEIKHESKKNPPFFRDISSYTGKQLHLTARERAVVTNQPSTHQPSANFSHRIPGVTVQFSYLYPITRRREVKHLIYEMRVIIKIMSETSMRMMQFWDTDYIRDARCFFSPPASLDCT